MGEAVECGEDQGLGRVELATLPGHPGERHDGDGVMGHVVQPVGAHDLDAALGERLGLGELPPLQLGEGLGREHVHEVADDGIHRRQAVVREALHQRLALRAPLSEDEQLAGSSLHPAALAGGVTLLGKGREGEVQVAAAVGDRRIDAAQHLRRRQMEEVRDVRPQVGPLLVFARVDDALARPVEHSVYLDPRCGAEQHREAPGSHEDRGG